MHTKGALPLEKPVQPVVIEFGHKDHSAPSYKILAKPDKPRRSYRDLAILNKQRRHATCIPDL